MAPFAETPIISLRDASSFEVSKEPDLLDGWWTSEYLFSLERRAIFSKTWVCIVHRSRFTKPGDYISLELAGFPVLIILGKDRIARAFHNVCRHRAYTITKKPIGSSLVLGCRYHGWSYDTMGNLVKAPQFDGIEGFNKSENGLFKIHTCTDRAGFIHINLDAGESLQAPSCEDLVGHAAEHDITAKSRWLTGWELCGAFNWKTIGASDRTGIGTPSPSSASASVMEFLLSVFRGPGFAVDGCHTFLADPTTVILVFPYSNIWATMTGLPVSASETTIRCDIFSRDGLSLPPATEEALKLYTASQAQALQHLYDVVKSIRPTEEPAQVSLLKEHLRLERLAGCEIFPGRREEGRSEGFCKAEKLCNELDKLAKGGSDGAYARTGCAQGGLEW